ncbi:hypothetical protein PsAD2_01718 [Pseudovibrio axinellae]|uniref:Peptidase S8/S53 domain-containing protein n=1 Tax=Pseudovibrio axinellae TaxID=989403 RepID=A0A165ZH69_9HYPH|nr:S8/S53 family peptidase [Pseudovibrio axinellae]KZL19896.1 hypothetical protein PsAD2_01718 [Pseudovibrio axinellae]SER37899.1 hypothetical protein SAMN05421798_10946 [Pseudovibrio axinellae]
MKKLRIALIDGPLPESYPGLRKQVWVSQRDQSANFKSTSEHCQDTPARQHAMSMGDAITVHQASIELVNYVVFSEKLTTTHDHVLAALRLASDDNIDLVHCSLGLTQNTFSLSTTVKALQNSGCSVVASAVAQGGPVFPAALPCVISVQGDARCGGDDWSNLNLPHAKFGAHSGTKGDAIRGASLAAAHFTGLLARQLQNRSLLASGNTSNTLGPCLDFFQNNAKYQGRENRTLSGV